MKLSFTYFALPLAALLLTGCAGEETASQEPKDRPINHSEGFTEADRNRNQTGRSRPNALRNPLRKNRRTPKRPLLRRQPSLRRTPFFRAIQN